MFTALLIIAKIWMQPRCFSEVNGQAAVRPNNGLLFSTKKKEAIKP